MTPEQILAGIRDGSIDPAVGWPQLLRALIEAGRSPDEAQVVVDNMRASFEEETGVEAVAPAETASPGFSGLPGAVESPFAQDRATAFDAFRANAFPRGASPGAERSLGRQRNAISPAFDVLQGLGDLPAGARFDTFFNENLGTSNIDPRVIARRAEALFGQDIDFFDQPRRSELRRRLLSNPGRQRDLARQAILQGVPASLASGISDQLDQEFGQFQTGVPIDPSTGSPDFVNNPFLTEFLRRRRR